MKLPVRHLRYDDIREIADGVLASHNSSVGIPVPIDHILEFGYGITVIPLPGLQAVHEVDAFLSRDRGTVYVDNSVIEHRSPNRYRFSLAHELGHYVLHEDVYGEISFSTAAEWKHAMREIPETDREWLEWQAYAFGGLILVPGKPLRERMRKAVEIATKAGFSFKNNDEVAKNYVSTWLGKDFEVSAQVIQKRLDKDGLWPPAA